MKKSQTLTQRGLKRLRKNIFAMFGLFWLIFISLAALSAGLMSDLTDHPPEAQVLEHQNLPPIFWSWSEEDKAKLTLENLSEKDKKYIRETFTHNIDSYILGTDDAGRDMFIRLLYGARVSLTVALIGASVALVIGVLWGAVAGYLGGWWDEFMMRFVDILYALPYIFFVIMVMSIFGESKVLMFICIGAISWLTMSRIVRGEVKGLKEREFVVASVALGGAASHIIRRHIWPNIMGLVIVYATLMVPQIILTETFLSYLGLGIQAPEASWGNLMEQGAGDTAIRNYPWQLIFPGITLSLTILSLNFLGDGLRDAFDPRQA
jgi:oligopeptide transport system permease protein